MSVCQYIGCKISKNAWQEFIVEIGSHARHFAINGANKSHCTQLKAFPNTTLNGKGKRNPNVSGRVCRIVIVLIDVKKALNCKIYFNFRYYLCWIRINKMTLIVNILVSVCNCNAIIWIVLLNTCKCVDGIKSIVFCSWGHKLANFVHILFYTISSICAVNT